MDRPQDPTSEPQDPTSELPQDPMSELMSAAHSLHEIFQAQVAAGFTERQALYLVAQLASGGGPSQ